MAKTFTITRGQRDAFTSSGFSNLGSSVYTINTNAIPDVGSSPGTLVWFFQHNDSFQLSGPPVQNLTFDSLPPGILFTPNKFGWSIPTTFLNFDGPPANDDITDPVGNVLNATNLTVTFGLSNLNFTVLQLFGFWNIAAQVSVDANLTITLAHTITGEYTTMDITLDAPNPAHNGDTVTLTAPSGLDGVASIQLINGTDIVTVLAADFVSQSATELVFLIPIYFNFPGTVNLIGIGNGVQFSGSVTLGTLTVLIENGSGVYEIVRGKTNDTIYSNSASGNTTTDVAIPNPFGRTGFVGA
jgi:hypothetical protein